MQTVLVQHANMVICADHVIKVEDLADAPRQGFGPPL